MFTINIQTPWQVSHPVLFRFMEEKWVTAFFDTGHLRLSSFKQFSKHADEQRQDINEGEALVLLQPPLGGKGNALVQIVKVAQHAYALSATLRNDDSVAQAFGSKSYIKINRPTEFGIAIARHVPLFRIGTEGPCRYQTNRTVYKPISGISVDQFKDPETGAISLEQLTHYFNENMQAYPYFLKHVRFAPQSEYRFIWEHDGEGSDYLDIVVPEARQFCEPPSEFHK